MKYLDSGWLPLDLSIGALAAVVLVLGGCSVIRENSYPCGHAHADYITRVGAITACEQQPGCLVTAEDLRQRELARAQTVQHCLIEDYSL